MDGLRGNPARARQLEARLVGAPGVRSVEANVVTGNLVVVYEDGWDWRDDTQTLASSLATGAAESEAPALAAHLATGALDNAAGLDEGGGARLLLSLALLLIGARGVLSVADMVVPRWYDLASLGAASYALLSAAGVPGRRPAEEAAEVVAAI